MYCPDKQIIRAAIGADGSYTIPDVPCWVSRVTVQSRAQFPVGMQVKQQLPPITGGPVAPMVAASNKQRFMFPPRYVQPEESGLSVDVDRQHVTQDIDLTP